RRAALVVPIDAGEHKAGQHEKEVNEKLSVSIEGRHEIWNRRGAEMVCVVPSDNANRCKRSQTIQLMQTIQFAAPGDPRLAVHMLNHPGRPQVGASLGKVAGACMSICRKWEAPVA